MRRGRGAPCTRGAARVRLLPEAAARLTRLSPAFNTNIQSAGFASGVQL